MSTASPSPRTGWASLKDLTGYQWFVFIVCCLAWDMDCLDQQLFNLARRPAMQELVPMVTTADPRYSQHASDLAEQYAKESKPAPQEAEVLASLRNSDVSKASGYSTSIFLIGWALGGIAFGIMGDRVGRVKTLMLTILLYAVFTGLSAISEKVWDFYLYRLLTGLGVGGVFAASVTLVAETMPTNARPFALGLFQASSALGNCAAALISMYFGSLRESGLFSDINLLGHPFTPWRAMFLVGIVPGLLVVLIQFGLREPEQWKQAVAAGGGKKLGSYFELLGDRRWSRNAILGLILALSGVIGLWGIAFFSFDLQQYVANPAYMAEAQKLGLSGKEAAEYIAGQKSYWAGITSLVQNIGSFFGIFAFAWVTVRVGRKPAFALFFILAGASTAMVFLFLNSFSDIFWMVPIMGFFTIALFGGYAIYFPELFPTRLRSTGTSFCYNVGRLIAASGPAMLAYLISPAVFGSYPAPLPMRYAGVAMCGIFGLGLLVLPFLPETKDKPLPE
ncbi:MAG TPA: MFS transporter [Urbifossiella sp.]|nr:MFS transporter [Urbifossiella sp.]